jgi:hypothetical protein
MKILMSSEMKRKETGVRTIGMKFGKRENLKTMYEIPDSGY